MRSRVALGLVVWFVSGCSESKGGAPRSGADAPAARTAAAIAPGSTITGTLREQIPVGPYVYVRLETTSGELWAAVNEAPLTLGQPVTVYNVMLMERFESQTLQRTFEKIYFGSLAPNAGATAGAPTDAMAPTSAGHPPLGAATAGTPPADDAKVGPIARATGANARSISELWTQKARLVGTTVAVRGVVVKYNPGVMGKNWVHLQDGSGDAARGTHDVAVTSLDEAVVGDTVTVTGTVRTNRDVGAGYTYALLIEEAKIAKK